MIKKNWLPLKEAVAQWWEKDPFRESATIAYYAIFSIPGLLAIVVSIAAFFFGRDAVNGEISNQVSDAMSPEAAKQIEQIIAQSFTSKSSVFATIVGALTLLFGATGVLVQFQKSLNNIWEVKLDPNKRQWLEIIKTRLFSLGIIAIIGFLMLVSMVITIAISALSKWISQRYPETITYVIEGTNMLVSLGMITILFAIMFKVLPDAKIKWRHVMAGGFLTAILFTLGKFALGFYFGKSDPASAYGAAGSLVLILMWVSYSSMIVFLGAEVTKAFAIMAGEKVIPKKNAIYVPGLNQSIVKANTSELCDQNESCDLEKADRQEMVEGVKATRDFEYRLEHARYRKWLRFFLLLWPLVAMISMIAPFIINFIVNTILQKRSAGQIDSLRLSILHLSGVIKGYHFEKFDVYSTETLDCAIKNIRLKLDRKALWKGVIICDVNADSPYFDFTIHAEQEDSNGIEKLTLAKRFHIPVPLIIDHLNIENGKLSFKNAAKNPPVSVLLDNVRVQAHFISTLKSPAALPTHATVRAYLYGGVLTIHLKADLAQSTPWFDIDAEAIGIDMTKMNDVFKAYGKFDVNSGKLGLFTEMAAKNGKYKGYVKPVIQHLDIAGGNEDDRLMNRIWEGAIDAAASIFKNRHKDQLATKIPVEGVYEPDIDAWHATIETLVNAFIQALRPSIDHDIDVHSPEEVRQ